MFWYFTRLLAYRVTSVTLLVNNYFNSIRMYHCMFHILYDFYLIFFQYNLCQNAGEGKADFQMYFICIVFGYSFELFALLHWVIFMDRKVFSLFILTFCKVLHNWKGVVCMGILLQLFDLKWWLCKDKDIY